MKSNSLLADAYDEALYLAEFSEPAMRLTGRDAQRRAYLVCDLLLTYLSAEDLCLPERRTKR